MKGSFFSRNIRLIRQQITVSWDSLNHWFFSTPERAILEAFQAAKAIHDIEIEQFGGKKISPDSENYSENVMAFWQGNLKRNLAIIKVRLAEFQLGIKFADPANTNLLEKLNFIDDVISRYSREYQQNITTLDLNIPTLENQSNTTNRDSIKEPLANQKNGVFPRSIGRTFNKIAKDFTPTAEAEFVTKYRNSITRTRRAIRFILLLIIIPLLTQHFSKQLLVIPILQHFNSENSRIIFLNSEMEETAIKELNSFERKLEFQRLIRQSPELSPEKLEAEVKNKAIEISEEFRYKSSSAISNIFADVISLISFAMVIAFSKKDIVFIQSLLDKIVYGLSDSAKAFLIILITDIFVGFHSPHGWEILLESVAEHLGLPASRNAIFLFIATFPVILNTIFKYWIFRYLSRLSPSALATLKEMDE